MSRPTRATLGEGRAPPTRRAEASAMPRPLAPAGWRHPPDDPGHDTNPIPISSDLHLLTTLRAGRSQAADAEWRSISESRHFYFQEWATQYAIDGCRTISDEVVRAEIELQLSAEAARVTPYNERLEHYLVLCDIAIRQQCIDLAKALLVRVVGGVLG